MIVASILSPETARIAIPVILGVGYILYHVWRWRRTHPNVPDPEEPIPSAPSPDLPPVPAAEQKPASKPIPPRTAAKRRNDPSGTERGEERGKRETDPSDSATGEELFRKARGIMHRRIPDPYEDWHYLRLLRTSATRGYAPAMMKLGDYAMRRGTWVEAYYWIWQARRYGQPRCDAILTRIRRNWVLSGMPNESMNVTSVFSTEAGDIARALLNIDVGRNAYLFRKYLKTRHPELL